MRHLIHIGFPKAGSTYLQQWFSAHPEIAYREGGIAGFYNIFDLTQRAALGLARPSWQVTSFEGLATPTSWAGLDVAEYERDQIVPMATRQENACKSLASILPNAKILIITRGFRALLYSTVSQMAQQAVPHSSDQIYAGMAAGLAAGDNPFDYDHVINLYGAMFGEANVIVLPYELLSIDPAAFMAEVAGAMDIPIGTLSGNRVNPALSPAEIFWYPAFARVAQRYLPSKFVQRSVAPALSRFGHANRLRCLISLLEWLIPSRRVLLANISNDLIAAHFGSCECLRGRRHYVQFAAEYGL